MFSCHLTELCEIVSKQHAVINKKKIQIHTLLVNGLSNNPGSKSGELGITRHTDLSTTDGTCEKTSSLSVLNFQKFKLN